MRKFQDISGNIYGYWTVLSEFKKKLGGTRWLCQCKCGTEKFVPLQRLKSGESKSCGCSRIPNIIGRKFGKLTVVGEFIRKGLRRNIYFKCLCECGNEHYALYGDLKRGNVSSCGCLARKPNGVAARNRVYADYKKVANIKNRIFELTIEDFEKLTSSNCFYCGIKPYSSRKNKNKTGVYIYNGIDRVDNDKGYILDNCVTCCETCNRAKLKMSKDQFLSWISRVFYHSIGIKEYENKL